MGKWVLVYMLNGKQISDNSIPLIKIITGGYTPTNPSDLVTIQYIIDVVSNGIRYNTTTGKIELGGVITEDVLIEDSRSGSDKKGIQLMGFGETSSTDSLGADYTTLAFNSLIPRKYIDDLNIPIFLNESSTFGDFRVGMVHYYIGNASITFDYQSIAYPLPIPTSNFDILNLTDHAINFINGDGNSAFQITRHQYAKNVIVVDTGIWEVSYSNLYSNIPSLDSVLGVGNTSINNIILNNVSNTESIRLFSDGVLIADSINDREVWYNSRFIRKVTDGKTFIINFPDLSGNTNASTYNVNFRPNVSGTVAYLSDISSVGSIYTTNGTLTGNRTLNGGAFSLEMSNIFNYTVSTTNQMVFQSNNGMLFSGGTGDVSIQTNTGTLIFDYNGSDVNSRVVFGEVRTTNKRGIQYYGYGEVDVDSDSTGVDYSELVYSSLVPRKFVEDAISQIPTLYNTDSYLVGDRTVSFNGKSLYFSDYSNTDNITFEVYFNNSVSSSGRISVYSGNSSMAPNIILDSSAFSLSRYNTLEVGSTFQIFSPTLGNLGLAGISLVSGGNGQSELHISDILGLAYIDTTNDIKGIRIFGFNETDVDGANADYSTLVGNSLVPKKFVTDLLSTTSTTTYLDPVISQLNTPPISPAIGDRHLVGTAPTGAWLTKAKNIAEWDGSVWVFTAPTLDNVVFVTDVLTTYRYNGTNWVAYIGTAILQNGNTLGASMIIGTRDNQNITFIQSNIQFARVNTSRQFVLSDNIATFTPFDANSTLEISADGPKAKLRVTRFSSNTTAPLFEGYKARGTTAAPLDTVAGDGIFSFLGQARVNGTFQLAGTAGITLGGISGTNQPIGGWNISLASGAGATTTNFSILNTSTATSGTVNMSLLGGFSFAPTSGTAAASLLSITGTINQTGGANGITRGIYITPTLTSASDFRGVEVNGTGLGLKLTNSTTGVTSNDGADISLNGLILQIRNREASSIEFYTNNTLKGTFDSDGGLSISNLGTDRYALSVTNTVDDNNYTRFTGSTVDYLLGFQTSRFLVKNNTTNADLISYAHATNALTLGSTTASNQNSISLLNSNASYTNASIGVNSTRKFYYSDGTTVRFWIKPTNVLATDTTSYETLVVSNNDIPNRKFVTDLIGSVPTFYSADATVTSNRNVTFEDADLEIIGTGTIDGWSSTLTANIYNGVYREGTFGFTTQISNGVWAGVVGEDESFEINTRASGFSYKSVLIASNNELMLNSRNPNGSTNGAIILGTDGVVYNESRVLSSRFGIQYSGFGETNITTPGAVSYSNLAFNSLVPKDFVDNNILTTDREQTHTTGSTVTVSNRKSILYINPSAMLLNLTITLPSSPFNGQEVKLSFGGTVTMGSVVMMLSIVGNAGHTVLGGSAITSANAGDGYTFKFQSSTNTWRIF